MLDNQIQIGIVGVSWPFQVFMELVKCDPHLPFSALLVRHFLSNVEREAMPIVFEEPLKLTTQCNGEQTQLTFRRLDPV